MVQHGVGRGQGQEVANLLQSFIGPLEQWLDQQTDRRLVRTFSWPWPPSCGCATPRSGLLLSELGAHVISPAQAPAGTKRLSNLLRSPKWSHTLLERFLWKQADRELTQLEERGELALAIWDESVLEKRAAYAALGIPEYWRFDQTGDFHGTRLAGDRLVEGQYEPIPIETVEEGVLQGYSSVLNLLIRWDHGELGWHDPETDQHIATFAQEREARMTAEARVRELEAELERHPEV